MPKSVLHRIRPLNMSAWSWRCLPVLSNFRFENIYIACGYTDLRYGIDGLAATVKENL